MSDLYHGEYPTDMTPAEAHREVKHTLAEQQRLNDAIEAEAARIANAAPMRDDVTQAPGEHGRCPWCDGKPSIVLRGASVSWPRAGCANEDCAVQPFARAQTIAEAWDAWDNRLAHTARPDAKGVHCKPWDRNGARSILRSKLDGALGYLADNICGIIDSNGTAEEHDPSGVVSGIIDAMIEFAADTSIEEITSILARPDAGNAEVEERFMRTIARYVMPTGRPLHQHLKDHDDFANHVRAALAAMREGERGMVEREAWEAGRDAALAEAAQYARQSAHLVHPLFVPAIEGIASTLPYPAALEQPR